MRADTPICVGSVSEPVLALAVLQLIKNNVIHLDDKLIKHLPYFQIGGGDYE